jgi:peptidoglycan/LPS O-acetylase OafA/YrhL
MAYHFDLISGGYLGVDFFFLISGYLIAHSLLTRREGRPVTFWVRRARRLLPALFILLAVATVYAKFFASVGELSSIRRDGISSLFFVSNWAQIEANADYWVSAPSPLRHLWSLGVEEQFYVVWPVLLPLLVRLGSAMARRVLWVRPWVLPAAGAGAVSVWAMVVGGGFGSVTTESMTRAYFGTDTRAAPLLIGSTLALGLTRTKRSVKASAGSEALAVMALGLLVVMWSQTRSADPHLWRGWLLVAEFLGAVVLGLVLVGAAPRLSTLLGFAPLAWLGELSYGLYLWHWPVAVVTRRIDGISGPALLLIRLVSTLALGAISWYAVERRALRVPVSALLGQAPRRRMLVAGGATLAIIGGLWAGTQAPQLEAPDVVAASLPGGGGGSAGVSGPLLPAGTTPRVLVIGDSLALDIGEGMERLAGDHQFEVLNLGVAACTLSLDPGKSQAVTDALVPIPNKCLQVLDRFDDAVAEFEPNLVLVIFGRTRDTVRELADGTRTAPCEPAYDEARLDTWNRLLDHVLSRVSAVGVTTAAYGRGIYMVEESTGPGDRQTDCMNEMTRKSVLAHPQARLIPLDEWVCPDGQCIEMLGSERLRWDGLHFGATTSPVAASWVLDQALRDWRLVDRG